MPEAGFYKKLRRVKGTGRHGSGRGAVTVDTSYEVIGWDDQVLGIVDREDHYHDHMVGRLRTGRRTRNSYWRRVRDQGPTHLTRADAIATLVRS